MHWSYSLADNSFGIASVCGLIPSLLNLPKLHIVIDGSPSDCIGSDAWRQAGLAVPPKEAISQRWDAVLKQLQEVCPAACMTCPSRLLRSLVPAVTFCPRSTLRKSAPNMSCSFLPHRLQP